MHQMFIYSTVTGVSGREKKSLRKKKSLKRQWFAAAHGLQSVKPDLVFVAAGLGVGVSCDEIATPGKSWPAFAVRWAGNGECDLHH